MMHHVEIYVDDLDATKEFWGCFWGHLGYVKYQEWDAGVSYQKGDTYIVFVQTEEKYRTPQYYHCHSGLNHLAFHAASKEMGDTITEELRARNITILYEDLHPFVAGEYSYAVFFEYPMRMKVELCAY
ncbi:MAG: hypothetical protein M0R50_09240 [Candidatus Cloacimonetes bacterium]|nr:hypothetical protein [Candidatus Cloacimonadota bacterium]MDD4560618.1 hypothetical protein [Candidatus Cloacimonadota bacterium]